MHYRCNYRLKNYDNDIYVESKESASILHVFIVNTNGLYLQKALGDLFKEEYITELNKVFGEIYNQIK